MELLLSINAPRVTVVQNKHVVVTTHADTTELGYCVVNANLDTPKPCFLQNVC